LIKKKNLANFPRNSRQITSAKVLKV